MKQFATLRPVAVTAVLLLLAIIAGGCGEAGKPKDAIYNFYTLVSERKFEEAYNMFASGSAMRTAASQEQFTTRMNLTTPPESTVAEFTVLEENIEGDTAQVKFSVTIRAPGKPDSTSEATARLVKEDGQWKISD